MATPIGLSLLLTALLSGLAAAQGDNEATGPLGPPVQNINATGNPTAPAQQPSTYTNDPMAPTYPAADDKPASRGGTIGDDPSKRRDMPDPSGEREKKLQRERAVAEPNEGTHTATPPGFDTSPGTPNQPSEVNPGAVRGGPQP